MLPCSASLANDVTSATLKGGLQFQFWTQAIDAPYDLALCLGELSCGWHGDVAVDGKKDQRADLSDLSTWERYWGSS